jgi:circadian clock protein KaiC
MQGLAKVKTGISGLDEISNGGLPKDRTTLICGGAGCGKSLMAAEFIVKGAALYNEPGVLMTFEEKASELIKNFSSLGFDLDKLQKNKRIRLDYMCT